MVTVAWDPIVVCNDLQKSCQILTERCLKLSAKWAAEQWMGLPPEILSQHAVAAASSATTAPNTNTPKNAATTGDPSSLSSSSLVGQKKSTIPEELEWNYYATNRNNPGLYYARTLLEMGEYAHAAAVLSQSSLSSNNKKGGSSTLEYNMPPPMPNLSSLGIYLRAYALYLAGERYKEEEKLVVESNGYTSANATSNNASSVTPTPQSASDANNPMSPPPLNSHTRNPYQQQLAQELLEAYEKDQLDAFGLHVYGMVLKAATSNGSSGTSTMTTTLPPDSPSPQSVLIQSILQFPYNWSAWLDLADIVIQNNNNPIGSSAGSSSAAVNYYGVDDSVANEEKQGSNIFGSAFARQQVERDIEEHLQPELAGHFMYHLFCAHLQSERQAHADALVIYERWMDPALFQGSPYLLSQYAICSYHTRQFATAKSLLEDLHHHMPYRLDYMDVYSNILYVQEDSVALSQLAHTAVHVDKYRAETCCIVGNYYSLKQQRAKAIQYFQRALKMDPSFTSAWTLMGHEYVEWKQTANAMQAYRRAVQVAPTDYRAWYGLGQTYELLNMNMYALYYYKQATQLRPYDARMWCAVGMTYTHLHRISDAIRAYERALQQDDSEGVATQKLAALYKQQQGQEEKAAACYWRHLEIRHLVTNNTASAVDANTHTEPESLEKMLQGIHIESTEAEALIYLANYHRKQGEYDLAAILLEYPGPEKEDAKAMLRELRSRAKPSTGSGDLGGIIHAARSRPKGGGGAIDAFEFSP